MICNRKLTTTFISSFLSQPNTKETYSNSEVPGPNLNPSFEGLYEVRKRVWVAALD